MPPKWKAVHVLICLLILLALSYGYWRSHKPKGGFVINHVTTFTLGFLFYWLLPIVTSVTRESISGVVDIFDTIPDSRLLGYEWSLLLLYGMFAAGDFLGRFPIVRRGPLPKEKPFQPKLWAIAWSISFLVFLAVLIQNRSQLFASYSDADIVARGAITATTIVLFSISLRFALDGRWSLMKIYFILSGALLLLGGRLYFVSSVLSVLAFISHRKRIRLRTLLVGGFVAVAAMGIIGVIRVQSESSLLMILFNVVGESLFTSYSLFSYLSGNPIAFINLPTYLVRDFANLVPSFLIGQKKIVDLTAGPFGINSPMGAMNSWVSWNVNFGLLGTAFLFFLIAYLLRKNERMTVSYLMLTGFLAFTFFRDPFSVSIVKNMFEFSLLIPAIMSGLCNLAVFAAKPEREIPPYGVAQVQVPKDPTVEVQ